MRQNTEMILMLFFPVNVMNALVELIHFIAQLFFPETTDMLPEYKFMLVIYLIGLKFRPWQTGRNDSVIDRCAVFAANCLASDVTTVWKSSYIF